MPELVDKQWVRKGLSSYSTAQVLGTLAQFGAKVTEEELRARFETQEPEEVSDEWSTRWSGRGKFKNFHHAAAAELFKRLTLRAALRDAGEGIDDMVGEALDYGEPSELDEAEAQSMNDALALAKRQPEVRRTAEQFRRAMVQLVGLGRPELMKLFARFATLHPELTECIVAHQGDREQLAKALCAFFEDGAQPLAARVEAGWHLRDLDAVVPRKALLTLLEAAEAARDLRLASALATLLGEEYRREAGEHYCAACRAFHAADERSHDGVDFDDEEIPY